MLTAIVQDPAYHAFADTRSFAGIPNFWNVVSNLAFLVAAAYGLIAVRRRDAAFRVLLAGTALTAFGSAHYHWNPGNATLVWDRLPMTLVFMSILAAVIRDRTGRQLLAPLVAFGVASVAAWHYTGDLLLYAIVQFGSMLAVTILLAAFPGSGDGAIWATIALYALAKAAEMCDRALEPLLATGGHPWKHAIAAMALAVYMRGVTRAGSYGPASGSTA